jgi:PAS domain S-box-containing protein
MTEQGRSTEGEVGKREEVERALHESLRELRRTRDELARSQAHLRDFVDNAAIGFHSVGPDGVILWANRAELELLGYAAEEYIGHHIAEFHADKEQIAELLARLQRGEEVDDIEARMLASDGTIRHVLLSSNGYREDGRFVHSRCTTIDVTARREAEAALRAGEQRLRTITDALPTLVSYLDEGGIYRFANQTYERWFGRSRSEIVGLHMRDVLGEAAYGAVRPHVEAVMAGQTVTYRSKVPYLHGGERHIEATYVPDVGPDDVIKGYTALVADVSKEQRLADARAAAADRGQRLLTVTAAIADAVTPVEVYDAIVDQVAAAIGASTAGLWLLDAAGRTGLLVRSHGYTQGGRDLLKELRLDGDQRLPVLEALRSGRPLWIDSQAELLASFPHLQAHVTPGRSYRIACLPVLAQGQTLGTLAFTFDGAPPVDDDQRAFLLLVARYSGQALERLRLLRAEQQSRARAELLYRLAQSVIDAQGIDDVFKAALQAIEDALHADRSAILVQDAAGVMRFRARHGLSDSYCRAVEGHSPWARDARDPQPIAVSDVAASEDLAGFLPLLRQEGIAALGFIPLMAGGQLLGKFMVYYDRPHLLAAPDLDVAMAIANHVGAAISRFSAVGELERTVRFNEMFTAILGHDLRNPLGAIMTAAHLALKRGESERLVVPLARIVNSGERMARMIDQLLDFTRLRVGTGIPLQPRPTDLLPLLRQVIDEFDANPAGPLKLEHRGDTAGVWDEDRLAQVLSNLIGNAVQHGQANGGVRVRVDGDADDRVRVEVHNAGAIPSEVVPRLFEPMTGGQRPRDRSRGLGLGLFIAQQIVDAHGGAIAVETSPEAGTTFTLSLPRQAEPRSPG